MDSVGSSLHQGGLTLRWMLIVQTRMNQSELSLALFHTYFENNEAQLHNFSGQTSIYLVLRTVLYLQVTSTALSVCRGQTIPSSICQVDVLTVRSHALARARCPRC